MGKNKICEQRIKPEGQDTWSCMVSRNVVWIVTRYCGAGTELGWDLADVVEEREKIFCIEHEALVPQDICRVTITDHAACLGFD